MYVEVELGLIAVHTQPEDIMWPASKAILPEKIKIWQPLATIMWGCFPPKLVDINFDINDTPENKTLSEVLVFGGSDSFLWSTSFVFLQKRTLFSVVQNALPFVLLISEFMWLVKD